MAQACTPHEQAARVSYGYWHYMESPTGLSLVSFVSAQVVPCEKRLLRSSVLFVKMPLPLNAFTTLETFFKQLFGVTMETDVSS